jgi:hypothetical protein
MRTSQSRGTKAAPDMRRLTNLELDHKAKALPTSNKCAMLGNAEQFIPA